MQRLGKYSPYTNAAEKDVGAVCEYLLGSFWVQLEVSYLRHLNMCVGEFKTLNEPAAAFYIRPMQSKQ